MSKPSYSEARLVSLDYFRGFCALGVFLTHWYLWANFRPIDRSEQYIHEVLTTAYNLFCQLTWNSGGQHPAVLGFFVLSGFCIHTSEIRRNTRDASSKGWIHYYRHRALRIFPVYWWGGLLGAVFVFLNSTWPTVNPMLNLHATATWPDFFLRATALGAWLPSNVIAGNWSLNTVSTEIAIYALYPLILWSLTRIGWWIPLLVMVGMQLVALMITPHVSPYWIVNTPLMMTVYWYVGMLSARWYHKANPRLPWWVPLIAWLLFLAIREAPDFYGRYLVVQIIRALGFASLLLWMVGRETHATAKTPSFFGRFMRMTGQTSYSLYVIHTPVIMAVTWALTTIFGSRSNTLQLGLSLLSCILATAFTYRFIERPFLAQPR